MKKKRNIAVIIIYILLSVGIITVGLFVTDSLPQNLSYRINSIFSDIRVPVDNEAPQNNDNREIAPAVIKTVELPKDMKAVWIDLDVDVTSDVAGGGNSFLVEAEDYFNYFGNFETDTVFIRPDTDERYAGLADAYGNQIDITREYVNRAVLKSYNVILILDDTMIYNEKGELSFDKAKYYLSNYNFSGVLLYTEKMRAEQSLPRAAAFFYDSVKAYDPSLAFGTVIVPAQVEGYADSASIALLNSAKTDFVLLRADGAVASPDYPFAAVMSWWNQMADLYPSVSFFAMHRTDLVCRGSSEWGNNSEIADQMRCMWDLPNISGSVFYSAVYLRENKASFALRIAALLDNGQSDELKLKSVSLDSVNNTVTFTGSSAYGHVLTCNHKSADADGGPFNVKYPLKAGSNTFTFFSLGKEMTYRVYNNARLISAYYPQTDINAAKDEVISINAVCMDGSSVVCTLNGKEYPMLEQEGTAYDGMPAGYSVYGCGINFTGSSDKDLNLGNIVITATLGDNKEAVTCGRVTLLKSNSSPALNKFLEFIYGTFYGESSKNSQYTDLSETTDDFKVSPYRDNGLGTALMCRICNDDTEQLGPAGAYDTYQPDLSALCEGTLDYVENMTMSEEGYIRYELRSGISVYGVNCELINNAFAMPANNAYVKSVNETASSTDIVFDMDWFVPVTVQAMPQNYYRGYLEYSYNVSSFTAEYVDITLHHTGAFYNQANLIFAQDSPFTRSELYSSSDGSIILRLYLRAKGQFYGFDISKDENSRLVISFKKHHDGGLYGKVIMLDPGHGGLAMTGTALADNSAREADVTLTIAKKTAQMLTEQGATVLMTRNMDTALDLDDRWEIQSDKNPDLFVSIHCDGADEPGLSGTHTFYFRPYSQPLANAIHSALVSVYKTYIYSPADTNYPAVDRGIKYYPFYVTRMNQCPAVLVETGFMTNPVEGSILAGDNCQYWIAQGITSGIMNYFAQNNASV